MVEAEYNIKEMQQFLDMTRGLYDIVRLVDPLECREISIDGGKVTFLEGCYNVWASDQRPPRAPSGAGRQDVNVGQHVDGRQQRHLSSLSHSFT